MGQLQRQELLGELRERIRSLQQPECCAQWTSAVSSGFVSLDRLLATKGFVGGTLVEWLSEGPATGALTLALAVGGKLTRTEGALVIVDAERTFFPPAAAGLGVPLQRTVVVQPRDVRTQWWALEQALLSGTVTATLGQIAKIDERILRRLLLAVEQGRSRFSGAACCRCSAGVLCGPAFFGNDPRAWRGGRLALAG